MKNQFYRVTSHESKSIKVGFKEGFIKDLTSCLPEKLKTDLEIILMN